MRSSSRWRATRPSPAYAASRRARCRCRPERRPPIHPTSKPRSANRPGGGPPASGNRQWPPLSSGVRLATHPPCGAAGRRCRPPGRWIDDAAAALPCRRRDRGGHVVQDRDCGTAHPGACSSRSRRQSAAVVSELAPEAGAPALRPRVTLIIDPDSPSAPAATRTTRMCLELLDQADLAGRRLIDYGAAPAFLAIAAARLGAAQRSRIDIDSQALASARETPRNGVGHHRAIELRCIAAPADVVVANILSNPLKRLRRCSRRWSRPAACWCLGRARAAVDEVAAFYEAQRTVSAWRTQDGWRASPAHARHRPDQDEANEPGAWRIARSKIPTWRSQTTCPQVQDQLQVIPDQLKLRAAWFVAGCASMSFPGSTTALCR